MVVVEVSRPIFNEETGKIDWSSAAIVRADGEDLAITGNGDVVPSTVVDLATGSAVALHDNPELWARNLPYAYRSGDLVAVAIIDTDPPQLPDEQPADVQITIPAPPALPAALEDLGAAHA
jgi:hypothetical protein